MESTMPVAAPAKATNGKDFEPISSSWRNNSRNSNGGVTAARTTRQKNIPRSPNHSRNSLILVKTSAAGGKADGSATMAGISAAALRLRSVMVLNQNDLNQNDLNQN